MIDLFWEYPWLLVVPAIIFLVLFPIYLMIATAWNIMKMRNLQSNMLQRLEELLYEKQLERKFGERMEKTIENGKLETE